MSDPTTTTIVSPDPARKFLGHPLGLVSLFGTEFFERFTYYGMRALLVLFLVAATTGANPGFGIDAATAGAVYGLYTGAVYLGCVPGGWIADRLIGQRNAVFWGGIIIAAGNFILAIPASARRVLPRPRGDRHRRGPAQAEHLGDRRRAVRGSARRAS